MGGRRGDSLAVLAFGLRWSRMNVIGFDDGPFPRDHRGDVLLVGVVCSGTRVDGIVSGRIRRDGANATRVMVDLVRAQPVRRARPGDHAARDCRGRLQRRRRARPLAALGIPVLVVTRRPPDMAAVKRALFGGRPAGSTARRGAARKWKLIEQARDDGAPRRVAALAAETPQRAHRASARACRGSGSSAWVCRSTMRASSSPTRRSTATSPSRFASPISSPAGSRRARAAAAPDGLEVTQLVDPGHRGLRFEATNGTRRSCRE